MYQYMHKSSRGVDWNVERVWGVRRGGNHPTIARCLFLSSNSRRAFDMDVGGRGRGTHALHGDQAELGRVRHGGVKVVHVGDGFGRSGERCLCVPGTRPGQFSHADGENGFSPNCQTGLGIPA